MGEYKPFRMKHQGKNPIHGNFPGSFKLSDASKPSTAQDPSGPPFIKAITGLLGGGKKEESDSPNDFRSPNKSILDIVDTVKNVGGKIKEGVKKVKGFFSKKPPPNDDNGDETASLTKKNRPKVSGGTA